MYIGQMNGYQRLRGTIAMGNEPVITGNFFNSSAYALFVEAFVHGWIITGNKRDQILPAVAM